MSEIFNFTAPTETFVDRVFLRPVCEDAESTAGLARSVRASESNQNQQNRAYAPEMTSRRRSPRNRSRDSLRDMDRRFELLSQQLIDGSTHACKTEQCAGGVGRNMAEALWRMRGGHTKLLTVIGDDADGEFLANVAPGLLLDGCIVKNSRTSMYAAVFDAKGECMLGLGDMHIHDHITTSLVDQHIQYLKNAPLVVLDGNVPQATMGYVLRLCQQFKKPVFFEPTDRRKATKPFREMHQIEYSSPNISELRAMADAVTPNGVVDASTKHREIIELSKIVSQYISLIIVTMGSEGVFTARRYNEYGRDFLLVRLYHVTELQEVENVSGAGDCFSSGFIYGKLLGFPEPLCVSMGLEAAKHALLCKQTVPRNFCFESSLKQTSYESWKYKIN